MDYRRVYEQLSAKVKGEVHWGEKEADYCRDFGGVVSRKPQIVVHVSCEDDIRHTLEIASSGGKPVSVRGKGHSCNSQTLTHDILLINHAGDEDKHIEILDGNRVSVPTRYTWYTLEKKLNQHGLMCPVLTDYLGTTIGGTLGVGGFGIRSPFYGAQVDQVERLKLVLPSGESVWCSPDQEPELFGFSMASLSVLGVIESVVMKVVPWEEPIVYRRCDYASIYDLDQAISDFLLLLEAKETRYVRLPGFPTNRGPIPNVPIWLEYGQLDTAENKREKNPVLPESPNRSFQGPDVVSNFTFVANEQDRQYVYSFADYAKLWVDFFFPREIFPRFLPHFEELLDEEYLAIIYVMAPKRPEYAPHIPLHPVKEKNRQYVSIGADFIIPKHEHAYMVRARGRLNDLLKKCIEYGGRPYLYGSVDIDDNIKRRIFGSDYDRLLQLKATYDPENIIVSSPFLSDNFRMDSNRPCSFIKS